MSVARRAAVEHDRDRWRPASVSGSHSTNAVREDEEGIQTAAVHSTTCTALSLDAGS